MWPKHLQWPKISLPTRSSKVAHTMVRSHQLEYEAMRTNGTCSRYIHVAGVHAPAKPYGELRKSGVRPDHLMKESVRRWHTGNSQEARAKPRHQSHKWQLLIMNHESRGCPQRWADWVRHLHHSIRLEALKNQRLVSCTLTVAKTLLAHGIDTLSSSYGVRKPAEC